MISKNTNNKKYIYLNKARMQITTLLLYNKVR